MLTYNEIIQLKDKLENNEITLEIAKSQYWIDFKGGQRLCHSKDWRERRIEFIKNNCEICNSTETLTLQHFSHPTNY